MRSEYGLEGRLTDLLSGRIIDTIISPKFKQGQFDEGVTNGVHAMISAVKGEFKSEPKKKKQRIHPLFIIFGFFLFSFIVSRLNRGNGRSRRHRSIHLGGTSGGFSSGSSRGGGFSGGGGSGGGGGASGGW